MYWLHRHRGTALLLYTLGLFVPFGTVAPQGSFPRLENIGAYKSVGVAPGGATCGVPGRSAFCQAGRAEEDFLTCSQHFCIQECPYRSSTPRYANLLAAHPDGCPAGDSQDLRPGAEAGSSSFVFRNQSSCLASPSSPNLGPAGSFTLTVWLKLEEASVMTVFEKSAMDKLVLLLTISETQIQFHYTTQTGQIFSIFMRTAGHISLGQWTHMALQVHGTTVSLFLNGQEEDSTALDTQTLEGPITDITSDSVFWIGQSSNGSNQFIGRMQDFRFYPQTLTNREIEEVFSGRLPQLHVQPSCRCHPSHPRVHPLVERYCIPNSADDTTNNRVLRLNVDAHPLHYINDNDIGTSWVSSVLSTAEKLDQGVTITIDLENGQYQVFYVILQFQSAQPESVRIQRRTGGGSGWRDWQYLAKNCSFFGMEDNGPLEKPDSVNCLQFPSDVPYSRGNITFSMLTPEPNLRPGYNNFYSSTTLQEFVRATHVRIHLQGQYHTRGAHVPYRHRYYAVDEITISGRCECHGHADSCDTATNPYRCLCLPESHTHGTNCERCDPLFNDKPFRSGDQVQAYNCRPCQCYGHAFSCHYNASMDPYPSEHFRGGGGVCDNCTHNTSGRNCERCRNLFYREVGTSLWAEDMCKPCECNSAGTVNGSLDCDQMGGQCKCKRRVSGRQCNQCQHGFYQLQSALPDGCRACNCNAAGTAPPDITCHQDSGQCQCKANVIGLSCDRCNYGFKFLNSTNPDGCEPCGCNPDGSLHQFCNPFSGQCECRVGVRGLKCDTCAPDTYGLKGGRPCLPCDCSPLGSVPGLPCDPLTGQCVCRPHVEGRRCGVCQDGYHSLGAGGSLGCLPCQCERRGTLEELSACDKVTGQCRCKSGTEGPRCNRCSPHMYWIGSGNSTHGCQPCLCDLLGSVAGTACDPDSGQCMCLPTRHGRECGSCKPGYFHSEEGRSECEACDCHPVGAVGQVCATATGQCVCSHSSLAGRRCDRCQDLYYGFNPDTGRCEQCGCDPVGGFNGSCLAETGQCLCKLFVTGDKCDSCVEGSSHMDPTNHLGCSKEPRQQPPPVGTVLSASAIELSWNAPDSPNSNALTYTLLRNSQIIHSSFSLHPFEPVLFTDSGLSPYTLYTYQLLTSNVHGNTSSSSISLRTLASIPEPNELQLSLVGRAGPTSASFNWSEPLNTSGPVELYTLSSVEEQSGEELLHYQGMLTEVTVDGLQPFTRYVFSLQACTNGGCARSDNLTLLTAQISPQRQPPPRVAMLSSTELQVDWDPPDLPNGIIIRYELFMQVLNESMENGTSVGAEHRVFLSSGWWNPQRALVSANENALTPPESSVVVSDLEPFTVYRFRVLTVNMAGSTSSEWTVGRTGEGVPEYMSSPRVSPVSSSSLLVSWETPREQDVRGRVTEYRVSLHREQTSNPYTPPVVTQLLYTASAEERSYTVVGLKPYEAYSFTVTVCNTQGCVSSQPASARTRPSAPAGLKAPRLNPLNTTGMEISWAAPAELNGPPPVYQVERTDVSLSDAQGQVVRGRRFTGIGYFHFPSSTLPTNTDFTGLQLSFRTRAEDGLILCALSPGEQEEYVALQIRGGRPYFLFDPQASAVALSPQNDGGRRYNDNQWHRLIATRKQAVGTIIVDDQYTGSASATSGSTIIGQNTGVYFGGLPENFTIHRQDTGPARLVQEGFAGCVREVLVQRATSPVDVWEPLDWDSALEEHGTYGDWEGCPEDSEHGAYFLGHGFLKMKPDVFTGGDHFEISFDFKTDQLNALLLFAYNSNGEDYILAELQGGILSWVLRWGEQSAELAVWVGLSYCDGGWNSATMLKRGSVAGAGLNEALEQQRSRRGGPLTISSPLYLGGVPADLQHPALQRHSLRHGFGGCIRGVRLAARGPVVNLAAASRGAVRVNLDGCLSADTSVNCRGNDSILVYSGRERSAVDLTLQPFTEYLYRVMASGEGGWTAGPWQRGRSRETVPQSVLPPSRVASVNGSSVEVSWAEPPGVRGVIERYVVKAYSRDRPSSPPISATFPNTQRLAGTLSGLAPFSSYSITLTACTQAGCGESERSVGLTTPQEAPGDVPPPRAVSYPSSLSVYWDPPHKPNGIITHYTLYHHSKLIYQGNDTAFNITDLDVYTPHKLLLSSCTEAGCTNSSTVTLFTGQLPPSYMEAPVLTVLDARSIYLQWAAPLEVNGLLEFYTLYQAVPEEEPVVVYNSSELFQDHTVRDLVPGATYLFHIAACTAGGCTLSAHSVAHTEESSPEEVPAPDVLHVSPHALNLSWGPPRQPNGIISSYGLWMNGALVQNSSSTSFGVSGLSPWSLHSFRVQACTAQGCALGPLTEVRTLEMPPVGSVPLEVLNETPRSVRMKWDSPAKPNGNLTYSALFTGAFYQPSGQNGSGVEVTEEMETRTQFTTGKAGHWVSIGGLLPYSNYSVRVRACNGQGCVESAPTSITLPPAAPDGLLAPRLAAATPTSLQVAWLSPARPNAPGPLHYRLQMKTPTTQEILQLVDNETTVFSQWIEGLEPFTEYQFRLLVSNSHGESSSSWLSLYTDQDRPGSVDPPVLFEIHSRNATIAWSPPSHPNGIITHYNIYQNGQLSTTVPGNSTMLTLSGLDPYWHYSIQVEACTEAGCTLSSDSHTIHTPPAPPEGVAPPRLYSDTPTSVLLTWDPPLRANGVLEKYTVERRAAGTEQISTVATVLPNHTLTYLDSSTALSPWGSYEYRVVASTEQGGSNSSQWQRVTTRPSRPAGLQPPYVLVLGPESVQVTWSAPLIANGEIERYEIRMPDPRIPHTDPFDLNRTVTNLVPYTNYSVTILSCSGGGGYVGGCTESLPTSVTTLPTIPQGVGSLSVVAISESFLAVSWQPPSRPNGPNIRYELLRRKTQQPLASSPPEDFNRWFHVYAGDKLFHEDKGLSRYTWYEYKLLVHNDVGQASGEMATGVTLAGPPIASANVSALVLNHTAILFNWTTPTLQDLQGKAELCFLTVNSSQGSQTLSLDPSVTSILISDLQPSTEYTLALTVSNGAHNITSPAVTCTTSDGEPEGVFPPEVVTLNSTSVRVLWAAPLVPNGAVTQYSIYLDEQLYASTDNTSGSLELGGLLPFTVYDIQVEVCTVYACLKSNSTKVTTVEDTPTDIAPPHVQVLSSRSVRLEWTSPGQPNGIMGGYDIRRRALKPCEELKAKQAVLPQTQCLYLECPAHQDFCGNSCYDPELQVCCGETLHEFRDLHECCGELYLLVVNASFSVCCGGQFLQPLPQHQCCGGYYVPVGPGEVCCPDPDQLRVSVGLGDLCCGAMPFSSAGGQICCGGLLHDGYSSQCCGGELVEKDVVCCGDAERGVAHAPAPGMACCGEHYINTSTSLCCRGPELKAKVHVLDNRTSAQKCCWMELIQQEEECCNGVAFDLLESVCADRAPYNLLIQEKCRPSMLCPVSAAWGAYCGLCDFNPTQFICTWVPGEPDPATATPTPTSLPDTQPASSAATHEGQLCPTAEELVYSGMANRYIFTDTELDPYTNYEYKVGAWNRYGRAFSPTSRITTKEDVPRGVPPPRWSKVGLRDDIIQLDWSPPSDPNGGISHYVILRDGQERYRGTELSFTDAGGIRPFQEYTYQLGACTSAGCTDSTKVVAVTVQGVPEGLAAPSVRALGPTALHISWVAPTKPNGIIREYFLIQSGVGVIHTYTQGEMTYNLTGLQPHTNYSFVLRACTAAGCGASQPSIGRTLQDAPAGVWAVPRSVLVNSTAVELYWSGPSEQNGVLRRYRLLRDGEVVFTSGPQEGNYTDAGLTPNSRYVYELEASTDGGSSLSSKYVIQTPVCSPEKVPAPYNVNVSGPRSVFVAWSPPGVYNSSLPVEYNLLLNAGTERPLFRPAGQDRFLLLNGLDPYTVYHIRVQACQTEGCGVGPGVSVRTSEVAPQALDPPELSAAGAAVIEVRWIPPHKPNGLITMYFIYRRPLGTQEELLVFIWTEGPLEFIDASDSLQPFTEYEYRVTAHNSQGSISSSWASTLTLEAEPQGMGVPIAWPTSAYSVLLNWTEPSKPNGLISKYRIVYQKQPRDPTLNSTPVTALTVPGDVFQAHVFGLEPYSTYSVRVEAVNEAGAVSSPWATVRTLQASPSGLANFSVEKRENGRALLLHWPEPAAPNGVIKMYNIFSDDNLEFSGLSRQFLFRRLEPYTTYSLVLEACTEAGCTRTSPQPVTTEEAPPSTQLAPTVQNVGAHSVELHWTPPGQPNGRILQYQIVGMNVEESRIRSDEDETARAKVLCTENAVEASSFSCNISGLQPWNRYRFGVRVSNAAGSTDSPWLTVHTKQAPPSGLLPPVPSHLEGRPYELLVSWRPPLEPNGVLVSYRIQRDNVPFHFSFDSSVLNYTDEDLTAYTNYSYAVIACTIAGCITSPSTTVRTLEAAPATVEPPVVSIITAYSLSAAWTVPSSQNGEILEYTLQVNKKEVYRGKKLNVEVTDLQPHTLYLLILTACTSGGCTASPSTPAQTKEAPPTGMLAPTLKVTGPESVEVTWKEPNHPNGVIMGYELCRDGRVIYAGTDTRYHDFTLLPSVEYSYVVTANNSQGTATSPPAVARTQPSAPSGVAPPQLQALGPFSVMAQWDPPARANGVIISYSLYKRDPAEPNVKRLIFAPHHSAFQSRSFSLTALKPYYRYEMRVEACTLLGCAASDWASVQTQEAPPAGQSAPLLELQTDSEGMQTVFLLSWAPPTQSNGKLLHYELYRRPGEDTESHSAPILVYRNTSTSHHDRKLLPYTAYEYQVWAVNSAGHARSSWALGRTGPAPPEGVSPPKFLRIHATSAVVDISPPAKPNGIVSLYRVFTQNQDTHHLLSEGTSRQQTLHGLLPFTVYSVGVEACTCYLCCSRGPLSELRTQASTPSQQPPPRPVTLTSRWALVEWDEPLQPNGIIESCELLVRSACPQPLQPVPMPCSVGAVETRFFGKGQILNITNLLPYASYEVCVVSYNNIGSTASDWVSITTLKEPPQYKQPFVVHSNLTTVYVDWTQSFYLNGPLRDYALTESSLRLYSGFHSYIYIPRTSDKTFSFQVTCSTDSGSASSPVIKYNTATGVDAVETASGGKTGLYGAGYRFYTELWFILLMAFLGLLLLALLLGLILRRALNKPPFIRERPPLQPLQRRSPKYPPSDSYLRPCSDLCSNHASTALLQSDRGLGLADTKITGPGSRISNHSYQTTMSVLRVPSQTQLSHAYSQNSLHRSVSQLLDAADKKSLAGLAWDPDLQGTDSGMYVGDEEYPETIKGFSSVKKEQTMFTDTHL
ncbi:usherin isoform X1 [Astyanax mexicanus]|uniref:usherin isoform X1 n=1 Tax=Astyanax mexicanus TaxID=7994 RepID=UPI0020CADAF9|nr:usherin isoform X1 [Astyanax mexicanus]